MNSKLPALVGFMLMLVAACTPPPSADVVATSVAATLTAMPSPTSLATDAPAPTSTPEPTSTVEPTSTAPDTATPEPSPTSAVQGTVEGKMCFPSEVIPAMTAYFEETTTHAVVELPITENQFTYSQDLHPGTYQAYAWMPEFAFGGSYSEFVPCGLSVACSDHTLIPFTVSAGETTSGVDICDWYGGPGTVPYPPGANVVLGSISGTLSYPSEGIPPLRIVAFNIQTGDYYYVDTSQDQATYVIGGLPPGIYQVVAYTLQAPNLAGGYSIAVLCGLSVDCTDHTLVDVFVEAGTTATGIDPGDWYAPAGAFSPNPAP